MEFPERVAAYQRARSDAHRQTIRRIGRQRIGDLKRTLPTELRGSDVTVDRPRACSHVPLVGGSEIAGGFQVFGDQCGVLVILIDRGGNALMQLCTIGFELRLVGDRTHERMPERVLGLRIEGRLVDEFGGDQGSQVRLHSESGAAGPG